MKKILIAEDDKFLANAYRVKLTKANYDVKIVVDGAELLQSLESYTPDLIILDWLIPKKDGQTVLATLKASKTLVNIPCIVASNLGQQEDIEKAKELGATDYIVKTDQSMSNVLGKIKNAIGD